MTKLKTSKYKSFKIIFAKQLKLYDKKAAFYNQLKITFFYKFTVLMITYIQIFALFLFYINFTLIYVMVFHTNFLFCLFISFQ